MNQAMKSVIKESDGLGNAAVPGNYNKPNFSMGTATPVGPGPDQQMIAQSAAGTPNGIDPLNKGFQIGGADDPLAEYEKAHDNPAGFGIGGGKPTSPMNSPSHPAMATMKEDGIGMGPDGQPIGEGENPFAEDGNPFVEDDELVFEDMDAVPAFEDIEDDPELAALPVDANGVIDPVVLPDEVIVDSELGAIPDVVLPFEEPIVEIGEDDVDIQIPENAFENDGVIESIPVMESFKLPENQKVVVSKDDQIFFLGHVREEFTPKFAESAFTRALKSLCENKGDGRLFMSRGKNERVAVVGRSLLVEVAKDWRLPGTSTVFEAHDLLQIVASKPIREVDEVDEDEDPKAEGKSKGKGKKENDDDKEKEKEEEKLKKEAALAYHRWKEVAKKKKEDGDDDDDDDDSGDDEEKAEKKKKKERAKRESAFLARQKNGGYI
jgi:hypothetical protein